MLKKVRIKNLPKKKNGGVSYNQLAPMYMPNGLGLDPTKVRSSLTAVPRDQANLEAEGGETALIPDVGGLPAHYNIKGNRHTQGGVPLNLPEDSFIYSDTRAMKIKDKDILAEFGETKPKTPAQIAKKYDINKYREILADPDMDRRAKDTAEQMISNYNLKLSKLALYQEAMKGFDNGVPVQGIPFMMSNNIQPQDILPLKEDETQGEMMDEEMMMMQENPTEEELIDEETMPLAQFGLSNRRARRQSRLQERLNRLRQQQQFDPRNGLFMVTLPDGSVSYVDANNVPMPAGVTLPQDLGFITPGTKVTKTSGNSIKTKAVKKKIDPSLIKSKDDKDLKIGDYIKEEDGTVKQVTSIKYNPSKKDPSLSGPKNYKPVYGSFEEDEKKGLELMEKLKNKNAAKYDKDRKGWVIYKNAKNHLTLEEKEFLTNLFSYNKAEDSSKLGTPNIPIVSQSQYTNADQSAKNRDGFYGFADPEMLELRYWQAQNPDAAVSEFTKLDKDQKLENRKGMLKMYGYDISKLKNIDDPDKLYTPDFVAKKGDDNSLVRRNERLFKGEGFRSEDDTQLGLDHLDKYRLDKNYEYGDVPEDPGEIPTEDINLQNQQELPADYWAQDVIGTLGAAGDLARVKKYTPWAPELTPYIPRPVFYDPTRELAANAEQAQIATDAAESFGSPQMLNARTSAIQGQGAKSAADVLSRYNNLNVGTANQFELTKGNLLNQVGMANAQTAKELYDATTVANQQYDNAKAQARQQLRQSYINAITNRAMAQSLNAAYGDHYMVDPASGGFTTFTGGDQLTGGYDQEAAIKRYRNLKKDFPESDDDVLWEMANYSDPSMRKNKNAQSYMQMLSGMMPQGSYPNQYMQEE